jgi:PHD/YefM family antitoxin component YafN of YafNO toxin-antitoxin module
MPTKSRKSIALKPLSALRLRHNLGGILNEVANQRGRFLVQRAGIPAAVLMSPAEYEELLDLAEIRAEQSDSDFQASLKTERAEIRAGRFLTLANLESDLAAKRRASRSSRS